MERETQPPATVFLRPIGSPVALGLSGLVVASLVVSGLELGWIAADQRTQVALVLLALPFPLQFTASVIAFLGRDTAVAAAMGVLSGTWLASALVWLASPPGSVSGALGLLLLASAGLLLTCALSALRTKLLPGLVFVVEALRFALAGIHELGGAKFWQDAAGIVGLVVVVLAGWAVVSVVIEHVGDEPEPGIRKHL